MHENISICPYCGSENFDITEVPSTLDGVLYSYVTAYVCNDCEKIFDVPSVIHVTDEE